MSKNNIKNQRGVVGFITLIILAVLVFNVITVGYSDAKLEQGKAVFTYGDYQPGAPAAGGEEKTMQKDVARQEYVNSLAEVVKQYYLVNARYMDSALSSATGRTNRRETIRNDLARILRTVEKPESLVVPPIDIRNIYVSDSLPYCTGGSCGAEPDQIWGRKIMIWVEAHGQFKDGEGTRTDYARTTPPFMEETTGRINSCTKGNAELFPNPNTTTAPNQGTSLLRPPGSTDSGSPLPLGSASTSGITPYVNCDPTRFYTAIVFGAPIQTEIYRQTVKKMDFLAFKFASYFKARQGTLPFRDPEINYFRPTTGGCATTSTELPCLDSYTNLNLSSVAYIKGLVGLTSSDLFTAWGDSILGSNVPPANYPWTFQLRAPLPWVSNGGAPKFIDITAVQQL